MTNSNTINTQRDAEEYRLMRTGVTVSQRKSAQGHGL